MHEVSQIHPNPAETNSHPFSSHVRPALSRTELARAERKLVWWHPVQANWVTQSLVTSVKRDSHAGYTCPARRISETTTDCGTLKRTDSGNMKSRKYRTPGKQADCSI